MGNEDQPLYYVMTFTVAFPADPSPDLRLDESRQIGRDELLAENRPSRHLREYLTSPHVVGSYRWCGTQLFITRIR